MPDPRDDSGPVQAPAHSFAFDGADRPLAVNPRRVFYRPAYGDQCTRLAVLFAEGRGGTASLVYFHGANPTFDLAAPRGPGQYGCWWEVHDPAGPNGAMPAPE